MIPKIIKCIIPDCEYTTFLQCNECHYPICKIHDIRHILMHVEQEMKARGIK